MSSRTTTSDNNTQAGYSNGGGNAGATYFENDAYHYEPQTFSSQFPKVVDLLGCSIFDTSSSRTVFLKRLKKIRKYIAPCYFIYQDTDQHRLGLEYLLKLWGYFLEDRVWEEEFFIDTNAITRKMQTELHNILTSLCPLADVNFLHDMSVAEAEIDDGYVPTALYNSLKSQKSRHFTQDSHHWGSKSEDMDEDEDEDEDEETIEDEDDDEDEEERDGDECPQCLTNHTTPNHSISHIPCTNTHCCNNIESLYHLHCDSLPKESDIYATADDLISQNSFETALHSHNVSLPQSNIQNNAMGAGISGGAATATLQDSAASRRTSKSTSKTNTRVRIPKSESTETNELVLILIECLFALISREEFHLLNLTQMELSVQSTQLISISLASSITSPTTATTAATPPVVGGTNTSSIGTSDDTAEISSKVAAQTQSIPQSTDSSFLDLSSSIPASSSSPFTANAAANLSRRDQGDSVSVYNKSQISIVKRFKTLLLRTVQLVLRLLVYYSPIPYIFSNLTPSSSAYDPQALQNLQRTRYDAVGVISPDIVQKYSRYPEFHTLFKTPIEVDPLSETRFKNNEIETS